MILVKGGAVNFITSVLFSIIIIFVSQAEAMFKGAVLQDPRYAAVLGIPDCSAVLVHPRVLLTAGHCLETNGKNFHMDIAFENRSRSRRVFVISATRHDLYQKDSNPNDIGAILLAQDIPDATAKMAIPPIAIPKLKTQYIGAGYGDFRRRSTTDNGFQADTKRWLPFFQQYYYQDVLVTAPMKDRTGACYGDSGGGLFLDADPKQLPLLVGILASISSITCGEIGNVLRSVVVAHHLDWIKKVTGVELKTADSQAFY